MVYVMSDIHGNLRRFHSVLEKIHLRPEDTLYILGDVSDRHPDGISILRWIMAAPNVKMLLGNHEYMLLRAVGQPYDQSDRDFGYDLAQSLAVWYRNGGGVTHQHLKHIRKKKRQEIYAYLKSLPLNIDITVGGKPYKLVHGAPLDQYEVYGQEFRGPTHYAVWKRLQDTDPLPDSYTLVFGHTPTRHFQPDCPMGIYYGNGRIGIDCGSGYPEGPDYEYSAFGRLACLRLDDGKEFYSDEPAL
ncbi:MAG: metallophosphoesterase [Eubacteriales bacterium]